MLERDYQKATPTIQRFINEIKDNPNVNIVNIKGSFGKYHAKDHTAGAAIDIPKRSLPSPSIAKRYFETFDVVCESHYNWSSKEAPIEHKESHLHCIDKFWLADQKKINVLVTSYNAEIGQTDSSPCVGATGVNVCESFKNGERPIALSQDLVAWTGRGSFKRGDKVFLYSIDYPDDWRCNGEFTVLDTMNKRFTKRADLFFLDRKDNISCKATITKV